MLIPWSEITAATSVETGLYSGVRLTLGVPPVETLTISRAAFKTMHPHLRELRVQEE